MKKMNFSEVMDVLIQDGKITPKQIDEAIVLIKQYASTETEWWKGYISSLNDIKRKLERSSEKFTKKDWVEVLKIVGYPILLIVGLLLGLMM